MAMKEPLPVIHTENVDIQGTEDVNAPAESVNLTFAAIMAENKPDPFGPGHLKLYILCAVCFLNATMVGFDGSLMGSINTLPSYTDYFRLPSTGSASTGLVFAIFQIGTMASAFFFWVADWQGRRRSIFIGGVGVIVGTIVTSTAKTLPTFIGGRFLLSFFATIPYMVSPLYLVEIVPPLYRGTIAGLFNTFYFVGSILATASVYGTFLHLSDHGTLTWRLPLWLQMGCPGMVALVILFFPESPRWLVANDRHQEARDFLVKYHANGDENHPLVDLEMSEIIESLPEIGTSKWKTHFDLRILFNSRARRYRTMLSLTFTWFGQFSGNNIISFYLPYLLANVGVNDTATKLLLNMIYAVVGLVFSTVGARFHDILGRRKMLLSTAAAMTICLAITAGTAAGYVHTGSKATSTASIAFIYGFGAAFAWAFTSMQPVYPVEVLSNEMRARGVGLITITLAVAMFLNTFVGPIALNNIGYWFYVFFVFWDCFEFIFIYLFYVETKGITLEELDSIFEEKNPRRASIAASRVQQQAQRKAKNEAKT